MHINCVYSIFIYFYISIDCKEYNKNIKLYSLLNIILFKIETHKHMDDNVIIFKVMFMKWSIEKLLDLLGCKFSSLWI